MSIAGTAARPEALLSRRRLVIFGRGLLWAVILTAGTKPSEVLGPGEQAIGVSASGDVEIRALILMACMAASAIAILTDKVRRSGFLFVPFLCWAFTVAVIQQSEFASAKQLGSYASWILFYVAATALLDEPGDYKKLAIALVASVVISALGGELQHLLGYGPQLGSRWPEGLNLEFMRTHTGGGGILLDAFTPYCAAVLLLSLPGSWKRQALAWLLVLWGTANILRGGLLALAVALVWLICRASRVSRRQMLVSLSVAALAGGLLFGGTIADKISDPDEGVNTSGRLDVWPMLTDWIMEEPLIGHGPDADMSMLAASAGGRDIVASHNELLSTGVNFGLIGVALLWTPLLLLLFYSVSQSLRASPERQATLAGATAFLIMVTILSLTDNTLRTPGVMILALSPVAVTTGLRKRTFTSAVLPKMYFTPQRTRREAF